MGSSETVSFTVTEEPKPFPIVLVAAVALAAFALVAAGLLVYHNKHKHRFVPTDFSSIAKNWKNYQYT
jgi:hypothetical protein